VSCCQCPELLGRNAIKANSCGTKMQIVFVLMVLLYCQLGNTHNIVYHLILLLLVLSVKVNSVFGKATHYGLDGPRIYSRYGARFSAPSRPFLGPKLSPK